MLNEKVLLYMLMGSFTITGMGQDLSGLGKKEPVRLNGNFSVSQDYRSASSNMDNSSPYRMVLRAGMNVALYGWNIPFSAVYSSNRFRYEQPFNRFSMHPSYKGFRGHIGDASMSFSPYSLNGYRFTGAGAEIEPGGKWKVSVMGGRLQKAVLPDTSGSVTPAFRRTGYGLKAEYAFSAGSVTTSVFYAHDDPRSLGNETDSLSLTPGENLVLGAGATIVICKPLSVQLEYAASYVTDDIHSPGVREDFAIPFFKRKTSSARYGAFKTMLVYVSKWGSFGAGVERVDPGYRTFGAYYVVSDFINYTLNYSGHAFRQKLNWSFGSGIQHDNLDGSKNSSMRRMVNRAMIAFNPGKRFSLNLAYSSFSGYTHIRSAFEDINNTDPYRNPDTLSFTQVSETLGAAINIGLSSTGDKQHRLMVSLNIQRSGQYNASAAYNPGSRFMNAAAAYNVAYLPLRFSGSVSLNYSRSRAGELMQTCGPAVSLRKGLAANKLDIHSSASWNGTFSGKKEQGRVLVCRTGSGFHTQNHQVNGELSFARRRMTGRSRIPGETAVTITYRYTFSVRPGRAEHAAIPPAGGR